MKNALLVGACLSLLALGAAPRRRAPGASSTLTIKDATGLTVTLTPPLTITGAETVPTPLPTPTPIPGPGAVVISSVVLASGAPITQSAGGSIVFVKGSGFGAGGTIKIANQVCAVIDWQPWMVTCKTPVVNLTQTGPVIVSPTGINSGVSSFSFSILAVAPVPGPTPTPLPPPPSKRVSVEWPAGSHQMWYEGHLQNGHGPLGSWSYAAAAGLYPEAFSPPYMAAPLAGFKPLTGRFPAAR